MELMHSLIHVFTKPGGSVEKAMEPHEERHDGENLYGHWDWFAVGNRWDGYFDGENTALAADAPGTPTRFPTPYGFITLEGDWVAQEAWDGHNFVPTPDYDQSYQDYLASVPGDTVVTAVDAHS
jgi:hypothetical protein